MAFTWVRRNLIVANSCILAIAIVEDDVIVVVMYPRVDPRAPNALSTSCRLVWDAFWLMSRSLPR
jgi:hypothetical protein